MRTGPHGSHLVQHDQWPKPLLALWTIQHPLLQKGRGQGLSSDPFLQLLGHRGARLALLQGKRTNKSSSHPLCMMQLMGLSSASSSPSEDLFSLASRHVCAEVLAGSMG